MSSTTRRSGRVNRELDQLEKDVLMSIMRDWVYHVAGLRSPWANQYQHLKRSYRLAGYQIEELPRAIEDEWEGPLPSMIDVLILCLRIPENLIDDPVDGIEEFLSMQPFQRLSLINRIIYEGDNTQHTSPSFRRQTRGERCFIEGMKLYEQSLLGQTLDVDRSTSESTCKNNSVRARTRATSDILPHTDPGERRLPSAPNGVVHPPRHSRYSRHPSKLPLSYTSDSPFVLFLSQLIPKHFDASQRAVVLSLLQQQENPRIPSCIVSGGDQHYTSYFGPLRDNRHRVASLYVDMGSALSTLNEPKGVFSEVKYEHPLGPSGRGWPQGDIPAEVFKILAKHIPRDDLVTMRLVCREFERGLSASLFESAVVPFRSEIFGMVLASQQPRNLPEDTATTDESNVQESTPSDVDVGMRVFQGWGPHIRNFALAFEVDEELLARPPTKDTFQLHLSFWGTYRWPHPQYNWFEITRAQERTADKKHYMTKAFSYLSTVKELGLSLDSGLGWLNGPDCSDRAIIFSEKPSVFGVQNKLLCRVTTEKQKLWEAICDSEEPWYYKLCKSHPNPDHKFLARYIELLFETGLLSQATLKFVLDFMTRNPVGGLRLQYPHNVEAGMNRRAVSLGWSHLGSDGIALEQLRHGIETLIRRGRRQPDAQHYMSQLGRPLEFAAIPHSALTYLGISRSNTKSMDEVIITTEDEDAIMSEADDISMYNPAIDDIPLVRFPPSVQPGPPLMFEGINYDNEAQPYAYSFYQLMVSLCPLAKYKPVKPNNMKDAQKEWLMETELAQRAFLSSYVLAVTDNPSIFARILNLNLAKVSSRYLISFDRSDFWDSLPNLKSLTIMVSPDWREISRSYSNIVTLQSIDTTIAVDRFITVLENQITPRKSIKVLKLGYVGGGEHATGLFARNQHVLPAPIYDNITNPHRRASVKSSRKDPKGMVLFPYVEDLTFVNCWVVPRVLVAFVMCMRKYSLRKMKLDSVSIPVFAGACSVDAMVGMPPRVATKEEAGSIPHTAQDFGLPHSAPGQGPRPLAHLTESPEPTSDPASLDDYLDRLPQVASWAQLIDDITPGRTIEELRNLDETGRPTGSIEEIEFNSCGSVKLGMQEMKHDYITPTEHNAVLTERVNHLQGNMLNPTPTDSMYLGHIVPAMTTHEQDYLIRAFGMRMGWGDDPRRLHNREDNQREGGLGRFSGRASRVV